MVRQKDTYELEVIKSSFKGLAALGAAWKLIEVGVLDNIKAYRAHQDADVKLQQALRATNNFSRENLDLLKARAQALQDETVFSATHVEGLQATALALGIQTERMDETIRAALAVQRAVGVNATEALKKMAKAAQGGSADFGEYGLVIDKTRDVVEQLTEKFGGFLAATDSDADTIKRITNSFDDMQAAAGRMLVTAANAAVKFDDLRVAMDFVAKDFQKNGHALKSLFVLIGIADPDERVVDNPLINRLDELNAELTTLNTAVESGFFGASTTRRIKEVKEEIAALNREVVAGGAVGPMEFEGATITAGAGGGSVRTGLSPSQRAALNERNRARQRADELSLGIAATGAFPDIDEESLEMTAAQAHRIAKAQMDVAEATADATKAIREQAKEYSSMGNVALSTMGNIGNLIGTIIATGEASEQQAVAVIGSTISAFSQELFLRASAAALAGNFAQAAGYAALGGTAAGIGSSLGGGGAGRSSPPPLPSLPSGAAPQQTPRSSGSRSASEQVTHSTVINLQSGFFTTADRFVDRMDQVQREGRRGVRRGTTMRGAFE